MICTIHDIWDASKGERPDGVCIPCRLESHQMLKEWALKGKIPRWYYVNHECSLCMNHQIPGWRS